MFLEQAVIFVLTYMHVACIIVAQKSSQNNDKLLYWNGLPWVKQTVEKNYLHHIPAPFIDASGSGIAAVAWESVAGDSCD